jgi:hypothetical protein
MAGTKPGHDEKRIIFQGLRTTLKLLAALRARHG